MTRDETIRFVEKKVLDGLTSFHLSAGFSTYTREQAATSIAHDIVNSLGGNLKLDPQFADLSAALLRVPSHSMM